VTRKLVIEITDGEGRTALLKRRDGVVKFLDNIDTMFKRDRIVSAVKGIKMFFVSEEGGGATVGGEVSGDKTETGTGL
jgi:hypothetical protein